MVTNQEVLGCGDTTSLNLNSPTHHPVKNASCTPILKPSESDSKPTNFTPTQTSQPKNTFGTFEAEKQNRFLEGEGFRCGDKYELGHLCKTGTLKVLEADEDVEEPLTTDLADLESDREETAKISLHAILGKPHPTTMKVHDVLVNELKLATQPVSPFGVQIGNGDVIRCGQICKNLAVQINDLKITQDFHPFSLGGADLVLGIQKLTWIYSQGTRNVDSKFDQKTINLILGTYWARFRITVVPLIKLLLPAEAAIGRTKNSKKGRRGMNEWRVFYLLERDQRIFACSTEEKGPGLGACESHLNGGTKTSRGGDHERSLLPRMAVQSSHGEKHDGSWRMCVDFTDLDKACPQDCYPLSEIDWKVESLCGYPFKCFLDAYKGYHHIQMAVSYEEKTAFHTSHGVYCYTKIPFGLKNADATYERLVDKAFDNQVGRNIEVYVDDLVIKSHTEAEMLRDIDETFRTLRKINIKLNPKKCTFEAVEGMFLGYMISLKGIKPCLDKTDVVLQLPSPRTIKEVQSLNGKLASLNRFLSKSAKKSLPLFKTLKKCIKKSDFHWTPDAEQAFKQLKQHLSELPLLVAPKPKKELIVYLSASHRAISAVLMTERGTVQTPVYFRFFQAHLIAVITDQPIKQIISRPDMAGRLQKWSVMLGEHNITYRPRTSTKGQILADFHVEKSDEALPDTSVGIEFTYALRFQFTASKNKAKYEALIAGLRIAAQIGVRNVHMSVDSKLAANHVLRTYVAKEENMVKYLEKAKNLITDFANFSISQVPRSKDKKADAISKIASTSFAHLSKQVLVEVLKEKFVQEEEVVTVVKEEGPTWMTPIIEYLKDETLPDDRKEASKLRIKARQYELLEGVLYRRSFLKPWLRNPQQPLTPITAPWPFYKWGIDIAGPFPEGPGKVKFLIVAMDYFMKWIEAKAVATITDNQVKKFVWDNIVCCFGLPGEIVSDNGKQFSENPFKDWCEKLNITQRFASVKYPQSNGLVERANRSLGEGIKARLGEGSKN
ncbi:reverse transcriptase domain-containing protein [Tanacetum coccineum]